MTLTHFYSYFIIFFSLLAQHKYVGKDPFTYNATTIDDIKAVETQPCASGWCGKSIESNDGEHLIATERMCLQRPPSDNQERCAETFYGNRKKTFFMCFCKGDLCNHATRHTLTPILSVHSATMLSLQLITLLCMTYRCVTL